MTEELHWKLYECHKQNHGGAVICFTLPTSFHRVMSHITIMWQNTIVISQNVCTIFNWLIAFSVCPHYSSQHFCKVFIHDKMGQNTLKRTVYRKDMDIGSSHTKTKSWENCSAFVHFQNWICLPKSLCGKFPLIQLVLHNENFYCAAASPRPLSFKARGKAKEGGQC